jgi:peptidoglycan/LPS O-acetylase OafA/YrhL
MALSSRLWQFMCGFLSYDCFVFLRNREGKNENASLLKLFVTYSLFSSLAIGLFMPLIPERQLNRLLITLISSLFLVLSDQDNIIFKWISELGNVSYSIYLIHWPLIEAHKYINLDNYIDSGGFPSINGETF